MNIRWVRDLGKQGEAKRIETTTCVRLREISAEAVKHPMPPSKIYRSTDLEYFSISCDYGCPLSFACTKVFQSHGGCDVFEIITIMECRCLAAKASRFSEHVVLPKVWLCLRIEF